MCKSVRVGEHLLRVLPEPLAAPGGCALGTSTPRAVAFACLNECVLVVLGVAFRYTVACLTHWPEISSAPLRLIESFIATFFAVGLE